MMLATATAMGAQSLWVPTFDGFISGSSAIGVGETLIVVLDTKTSLSYKASYIDSKQIQIELSGGDAGNLFDFLPSGNTSSNDSISGGSEINLASAIAVRVLRVDESGSLFISGTRSISMGGAAETITVSGGVDPNLVEDGNRVAASAVSDLRLVYSGPLDSSNSVLSSFDLVRTTRSTAVGTTTDATTETTPDATAEVASTGDSIESTTLSDRKRDELLVLYLNRLIDLIFKAP